MNLSKKLDRFSYYIIFFLLLLTPLHAFLSTFFIYQMGLGEHAILSFILKAWKEILIVILLFLASFKVLKKEAKLNKIHLGILVFFLISLIVSFLNWKEVGFSQLIWGFRTEVLLLFLLGSLLILVDFLRKNEVQKLLITALTLGLFAILFGILFQIIGYEQLVYFGFRDDWSTFFLNQAPAFCQMEGETQICRTQSFFAGPTRFSSQLLILIFLTFYFVKNKFFKSIYIILAFIALALTQTTAAFLAIISALIIYGFYKQKKIIKKRWKIFSLLIFIIFVILICLINKFIDIEALKHSDQKHIKAFFNGINMFFERPFGYGLGSIGPASFKVGKDIFSENWFLMTLVNSGILGLLSLLFVFGNIFINLLNLKTKTAQLALLSFSAILVQNLFLDTLAEFSMFILLFFIISLALSKKHYKIIDES